MSNSASQAYNERPNGLIEFINPPDVTLEKRPPLVDFDVISTMIRKYEARNKDRIIGNLC